MRSERRLLIWVLHEIVNGDFGAGGEFYLDVGWKLGEVGAGGGEGSGDGEEGEEDGGEEG